jgi:hypothetical protein
MRRHAVLASTLFIAACNGSGGPETGETGETAATDATGETAATADTTTTSGTTAPTTTTTEAPTTGVPAGLSYLSRKTHRCRGRGRSAPAPWRSAT